MHSVLVAVVIAVVSNFVGTVAAQIFISHFHDRFPMVPSTKGGEVNVKDRLGLVLGILLTCGAGVWLLLSVRSTSALTFPEVARVSAGMGLVILTSILYPTWKIFRSLTSLIGDVAALSIHTSKLSIDLGKDMHRVVLAQQEAFAKVGIEMTVNGLTPAEWRESISDNEEEEG